MPANNEIGESSNYTLTATFYDNYEEIFIQDLPPLTDPTIEITTLGDWPSVASSGNGS